MFSESLAIHQAEQHRVGMAECLIGFASIAVLIGKPAVGVHLLAAAAASGKQRTPYAWPTKRMDYEEYLELARSSLTAAEFQAAQTAGSAMSLEQAIDYAFNLARKPNPAPEAVEKPGGLTERETAILSALARGLSNEAIGKELWVAEQTVKFHLTNIYRKLGVSNRTEAARLAYQHGLVESPIADH